MACTLMSREACSPEREKEWMIFFPDKTCAYCGRPATHLDHLYAMIEDRRPTGYGTEPGNLVPCCDKCNQPKGKMHWEDFMRNGNCNHIGSKKNPDPCAAMQERIDIIRKFQTVMPAHYVKIDASLMSDWDKLLSTLDQALIDADIQLGIIKTQLYALATIGLQGPLTGNAKIHAINNSAMSTANQTAVKSSGYHEPIISLIPSDIDIFKSELLQRKQAIITWVYGDGSQENKIWDASKFKTTSSVRGNLQSRAQWRNKSTNGLVEVRVRIK